MAKALSIILLCAVMLGSFNTFFAGDWFALTPRNKKISIVPGIVPGSHKLTSQSRPPVAATLVKLIRNK